MVGTPKSMWEMIADLWTASRGTGIKVEASLEASEITLGAVEIKDADTADRLKVNADGSINVVGGATASSIQLKDNASPTPNIISPATEDGNLASVKTATEGLLTSVGSVTITPTANTIMDRLKVIATALAGVLSVGGNVASSATDSGNPVKVGQPRNEILRIT